MGESLQDPSGRAATSRGNIIQVPAGTLAGVGSQTFGPTLRVDRGTWAIRCGRVINGGGGAEIANAPLAADPTFPFAIGMRLGMGAAGYVETVPMLARGFVMVRAADFIEAALSVTATTLAACQILLGMTQIVVPPITYLRTVVVTADLNGFCVAPVPPFALRAMLMGQPGLAVTFLWRDAAGVTLASNLQTTAPGAVLFIPATAADLRVSGLPFGTSITVTFECMS